MKKEPKAIIITIVMMSAILSCVMFMQFKVVNQTNIEEIETMREDELNEAVANWKEKYEQAFKELEDTNERIKEYRDKLQDNVEIKELVERELAEAQENFGLTEVIGDGIIVTITDNEEKSVKAMDLLDLVNELKVAGSKAISINEQRVTNLTDLVDISTKYIKVNSENISSPYVIKAIGDKTYLKSALTIKNGYFDLLQKEGYNIKIEEKNNIKINKYLNDVTLKYIKR